MSQLQGSNLKTIIIVILKRENEVLYVYLLVAFNFIINHKK